MAARGHEVHALRIEKDSRKVGWQGVAVHSYSPARGSSKEIHPWVADLETKVIRGEAAWRKAVALKKAGLEPNLIYAHPGWGESLFLKELWPRARLVLFGEFYYSPEGADTGFDPEFPSDSPDQERCRVRMKNLNQLAQLQLADLVISPTRWQASQYPQPWADRMEVVHDGIETDALAPDPSVKATLASGQVLTRDHEVITFVARHLEPYRGFHVFMRALPSLLARRPRAHVLIVGADGVSYGARPRRHRSWRECMLEEVGSRIAPEQATRVHFLGRLDRAAFTRVLQLSRVHIYLTYPFVLSWSLVEAMSVGCAIVASDTAPVAEVLTHGKNAALTGFFDVPGLVDNIEHLLEDQRLRPRLSLEARATAMERFDLKRVCLPRQIALLEDGLRGRPGPFRA